jgi:glycosyltransferase involved in cell wall biosynthesis
MERRADSALEVSVVMPCLNEADTLATCIAKARRALAEHRIAGEIIVADNGSTDGCQAIAEAMGARLVHVPSRGYGHALKGGIAAAQGEFVIIGDADDSYDFATIPDFVARLREGFDLVQGCRLPAGGGRLMPGAMPPLHRWVGNPLFTRFLRRMFRAPVHDVYCGLRGIRRTHWEQLDQRCTGMEFAAEMVVKSSLLAGRISEIPITLYPDGRKAHAPHLKTFRDGWRTVRFSLLYSPRWLFLLPGLWLIGLGLVGYAVAMPRLTIFGVRPDAHTLLFASLAILCGYQSILFAILSKTFAVNEGLLPRDPRLERFFAVVNLERGLVLSLCALALGSVLLIAAFDQWRLAGFGALDYSRTMRWVIPGFTLTGLGFQTLLSSFFVSMLGMHRA